MADGEPKRWKGHPKGALLLRAAAFAVPVLVAVQVTALVSRLLPRPTGLLATVGWWVVVIVASTAALVVVDRQARRVLPLAALLRLSMAFPDRAPSRFKVALRAGTLRNLEERLEQMKRGEVSHEPSEAAAAILVLASALAGHDRRTRGHSERVRGFTELIAEEMGLPEHDRDRLRWAALLHDIGKVRVHPQILNKEGELSDEEWETIHRHPVEGARITAPLRPWLGPWADTIEQHHERWDGSGYPKGLRGEQISQGARIVAVADAFEVMTAARSYKVPLRAEAARNELAGCAGTHFDPAVVRAFLNLSIGRMRWVMGPVASLTAIPVVGQVVQVGAQVSAQVGAITGPAVAAAAAPTASAAAGATAALTLAFLGGAAQPPAPAAPVAAAEQPSVRIHELPPQLVLGPAQSPPAPDGDTVAPSGSRPADEPAPTAGPEADTDATTPEPDTRPEAHPAADPAPDPEPTTTTTTEPPPTTTTTEPPPPNGPPLAVDDDASTTPGQPVTIAVLKNDSDPDGNLVPQTLSVTSGPEHGAAQVQPDGSILYAPADGFTGGDVFVYTICDDGGACSTATVRVDIVSAASTSS